MTRLRSSSYAAARRRQMIRLRSPSLRLRPSGYDPTRHRGTQKTDVRRQKTDDSKTSVICYWLLVIVYQAACRFHIIFDCHSRVAADDFLLERRQL